ncbi:chemotaxis protein CheX [Ferviditalea candida]|uniref:Chemotaxis protein CheX n=1 Tax=Ferviditalea candida TaxID=3108399 RepID=A0ABU5ZJZ6_9BACL|nr:chemotaxis protein CheX [Paenibacillaceae bacterium T2]
MQSLSVKAGELLECAMDSVKQVMPVPVAIGAPGECNKTLLESGLCVLIGFTGDLAGRLLIDGDVRTFGKLGETMFGMTLEGEMLFSFAGEVANMLAGGMSVIMASKGGKMDITPPTVMEGEMKLFGFHRGAIIPATLEGVGGMNLVLLFQEEKAV